MLVYLPKHQMVIGLGLSEKTQPVFLPLWGRKMGQGENGCRRNWNVLLPFRGFIFTSRYEYTRKERVKSDLHLFCHFRPCGLFCPLHGCVAVWQAPSPRRPRVKASLKQEA